MAHVGWGSLDTEVLEDSVGDEAECFGHVVTLLRTDLDYAAIPYLHDLRAFHPTLFLAGSFTDKMPDVGVTNHLNIWSC